MSAPYKLVSPCANCPFRTDVRPYLTRDRVREIARSLVRSEFPCHKTVTYDEDGEPVPSRSQSHCAGALILLEKLGQPSQMMRIAERLGMYDARKLDMSAAVFDSFEDMVQAQPSRRSAQRTASELAVPTAAHARNTAKSRRKGVAKKET